MDTSLDYLLTNVQRLVKDHPNWIPSPDPETEALATAELKALIADLESFKSTLTQASQKGNKDQIFKKWERDIREALAEIEDKVDACVSYSLALKAKRSSLVRNLFAPGTSFEFVTEVKKLREEKLKPLVDQATVDFLAAKEVEKVEFKKPIREKTQTVVGFEQETTQIIDLLNVECLDKLGVEAIVGMAGLGKTTLARKIFEDERVKRDFPVRLWIQVSENLTLRTVLQNVYTMCTGIIPTPQQSLDGIRDKIRDYFQAGRYLIVMDDVSSADAWEKMKIIMPRENNVGKILVTTRNDDVAKLTCTGTPHYLRFLNADESWELLQYEVYGELNAVPKELVDVGHAIATVCAGLPLSLVVIGGYLAEKNARIGDDVSAIKSEWEDVSTSLKPNLVAGDRKQQLASIILLSYEKLPYELKNCFLYLGMFPEFADIPVKKIIRLWIAEGFIQESEGKSMEETGYDHVKELVNRSLLMVQKKKPDGELKICNIHDSVREICKEESQFSKLNLFHEITRNSEGSFDENDVIGKSHRLCLHSFAHDYFLGKPKLPITRSFLSFQQPIVQLVAQDMSTVTDSFAILRVYEAKNIKFPKLPRKLLQLLHLRYLTIVVQTELRALPDVTVELWNLQSLIVYTAARTLEFKGDVWRMESLRHMKTKAAITFKKDGCDGGDKLQTLSRLSPNSCTEEVFTKAKNLITLGIRGDLSDLAYADHLNKLTRLNKLKLIHEVIEVVPAERFYMLSQPQVIESPLPSLPDPLKYPANIKILVVSHTLLEWKEISKLSQLASLEVLKLTRNAFTGSSWEAVEGGFLQLVRLHIDTADVSTWTATEKSFPELKSLCLVNCEQLQEVPSALKGKLETLSLERVNAGAVKSAFAIENEKIKEGKAFKLEITPADKLKA